MLTHCFSITMLPMCSLLLTLLLLFLQDVNELLVRLLVPPRSETALPVPGGNL